MPLSLEHIPPFRSDMIDRGLPDGRRVLLDPLTGAYFACRDTEDRVRRILDRPMSLNELLERVRRNGGPSQEREHLQQIVETFHASGVLEPSVNEVESPRDLVDLLGRIPGFLRMRHLPDVVPADAPYPDPPGLFQVCRRAEANGETFAEVLTREVARQWETPTELHAELQLAIKLSCIQRQYQAQQRLGRWRHFRWLRFVCWRIPILKRGVPGLERLAFLANPFVLVLLAACWMMALLSAPRLDAHGWLARSNLSAMRLVELVLLLPISLALHELAHAIVCVRLGGRIRELGLFLIPGSVIPYVDVSDTWTLPRWKRQMVNIAGSLSDMTVASIGVIGLAFWAPADGPAARILTGAITIGLLSLALNLNPVFRFDGYFILSDGLGIPNLRSRSIKWVVDLWRRAIGHGPTAPLAPRRERLACAAYLLMSIGFVCWTLGVLFRTVRPVG